MHRYYARLLDKYKLPIYPVALLTFSSPLEAQPTSYEINFPGFEVLRFNYRVIQLNRLAWQDFVSRPNPVAAALMSRMKIAKQERVQVKAECLSMLLGLDLEEESEDLVWEIIDTYLPLNEKEAKTFQHELATIVPDEEEAREFMTLKQIREQIGEQRGLRRGRAEGIHDIVLRQVRRRFGSDDDGWQQQVRRLSVAQLEQLAEDLLDFSAPSELTAWLDQHAPDTMTH